MICVRGPSVYGMPKHDVDRALFKLTFPLFFAKCFAYNNGFVRPVNAGISLYNNGFVRPANAGISLYNSCLVKYDAVRKTCTKPDFTVEPASGREKMVKFFLRTSPTRSPLCFRVPVTTTMQRVREMAFFREGSVNKSEMAEHAIQDTKRVLSDLQTLEEAGITDNQNLFLIRRVRGGANDHMRLSDTRSALAAAHEGIKTCIPALLPALRAGIVSMNHEIAELERRIAAAETFGGGNANDLPPPPPGQSAAFGAAGSSGSSATGATFGLDQLAQAAGDVARLQPDHASQPNNNVLNINAYTTSEPLWKVAKGPKGKLCCQVEPDVKHTRAHRPMCTILSGLLQEDDHDSKIVQIISRVFMRMMFVDPKHDTVKWPLTVPSTHGGGPFYAASQTYVEPSSQPGEHSCVVCYGPPQTSKSPETAFEAYCQFHLEGLAPIIFIRNRGGMVVGSTDMANAVNELGERVRQIIPKAVEDVCGQLSTTLHDRWVQRVAEKLILAPRVSSKPQGFNKEVFEFGADGTLAGPQVMIACINKDQVQLLYNLSGKGLAVVARESNWKAPLCCMFSDCVVESVGNPQGFNCRYPLYRPNPFAAANMGSNRETFRIALLFDEDDIIKSAQGKGAMENRLHGNGSGGLSELINMQAIDRDPDSASDVSDEVVVIADEVENEDEMSEDAAFKDNTEGINALMSVSVKDVHKSLRARMAPGSRTCIRASVGSVIAYTATPASEHGDIITEVKAREYADSDRGIQSANPAFSREVVKTVVMVPSAHYVGYDVGDVRQTSPWVKHFVDVRTDGNSDGYDMHDRVDAKKLTKTQAIMELCTVLGYSVQGNPRIGFTGFPEPILLKHNSRCGYYLQLSKGRGGQTDLLLLAPPPPNPRGILFAGELREHAEALTKAKFSSSDLGVDADNIKTMLKHMHAIHDGRVEPFRLGLLHTNHTTQLAQQSKITRAIFELPDEYCKGLFIFQYSGQSTTMSWRHDERVAAMLKDVVDDLKLRYVNDGRMYQFLSHAEFLEDDGDTDDGDTDDEDMRDEEVVNICHIKSLSNINSMLTIARAYYERMREQCPYYKQTMLVVSGAIVARGVRIKDGDHLFYDTDMFYAFNQSSTALISADCSRITQAIGRVCTLRTDFSKPADGGEYHMEPTLWISPSNWLFAKLSLEVQAEYAKFAARMNPGELFATACKRLLVDNRQYVNEFPALYKLLTQRTGENAKGAVYARINHTPKVFAPINSALEQRLEEAGEVAEQLPVIDHDAQEARREQLRVDRIQVVLNTGQASAGAAASAGSSGDVAPRKRARNVVCAGKIVKRRKVDTESEYGWNDRDKDEARGAINQIISLKDGLPRHFNAVQQSDFVELFVYWYIYYMCEPSIKDKACYHGVRNKRKVYINHMKSIVTSAGKRFVKTMDDLPLDGTPGEKQRTWPVMEGLVLHVVKTLPPEVVQQWEGNTWVDQDGVYGKDVKNLFFYIKKWHDLFPRSSNLKRWLFETPAPTP